MESQSQSFSEEEIFDIVEENYSYNDEDNDNSTQTNHKKVAKLHTIQSKLKMLNYTKNHTKKDASVKFGEQK